MLAFVKSALLAAAVTVAAVSAAPASTISFLLSAPILNGPLAGFPLLAVVSYDDTALVNGDEALDPVTGSVTISDLGGGDLTSADVNYPDLPQVQFANFIPVTIDFLLDVFTYPDLALAGIDTLWVGGDLSNGDLFDLVDAGTDPATGLPRYNTYSTVEMAYIPLPAGLPMLLGGLGMLALVARRRRRG